MVIINVKPKNNNNKYKGQHFNMKSRIYYLYLTMKHSIKNCNYLLFK